MNPIEENRKALAKRRSPQPPMVHRFAGEAFAHEGNPPDGPMLRRLASEVAWKKPPGADVKSQISA